MLYLRIEEAEGLPLPPRFSIYCPLVQFSSRNTNVVRRGRRVDSSVRPEWRQRIHFPVQDLSNVCIEISVIDANPVSADETPLASVTVDWSSAANFEVNDIWIPLATHVPVPDGSECRIHIIWQKAPVGHPPFAPEGAEPPDQRQLHRVIGGPRSLDRDALEEHFIGRLGQRSGGLFM